LGFTGLSEYKRTENRTPSNITKSDTRGREGDTVCNEIARCYNRKITEENNVVIKTLRLGKVVELTASDEGIPKEAMVQNQL